MDFLGQFHPQITHGPIVLIIVGLVFEGIGRALDRDWWRKAGLAMLVFGVAGAILAVVSGTAAGEVAEKHGVPESAVDAHEEIAKIAMWLGIATLVLRLAADRLGKLRTVVTSLALVAWLGAAITVGIAAHRGGGLVFDHAAGVKAGAQARSDAAAKTKPAETESDEDHEGH